MRSSQSPPMRRRHSAVSVTIFFYALSFFCVLSGCKVMTTAQMERLVQEEVRAIEGERVKAELERKQRELNERDRVTKVKAWRRDQLAQAQVELSNNRPRVALELVSEILQKETEEETEERVVDQATGETETITHSPVPIPDQEKAQILALKALAQNELKETDSAIETYQEVLKLDPSQRRARQNLGRLFFRQKEFHKALEIWQLEFDEGYWDADILDLVGQAHYHIYTQDKDPSRLEAARHAMAMALVDDPDNLTFRQWLASLEYESKRYGEAIRLLEGIRKQYPTDRKYLELLGDVYVRTEDYDKALEILELTARLSEKQPDRKLCRSISDLYAVKGLYGTAADWLIRGRRNDVEKTPAGERLEIGRLLYDASRPDDAVQWLEAVKEKEKEYAEAQSFLATLYRDVGREDDALAAFENIRRARPTDGNAHLSAGDIYLARKDFEAAFEAYNKASTLERTKADGFAGLAELAYEKKELKLAADYYRKAVEASPNERRYLNALREIEEEIRVEQEYGRLTPEVEESSQDPVGNGDAQSENGPKVADRRDP